MSVQRNNQPLVSVLVPSYNHSKYIEACLDSIYNSKYENLQVVVIDDNSSDGSQELLKQLQKKYDFELILKDQNQGLVHSLNMGLQEFVEGEIVKLVASDDMIVSDAIDKAVKFFTTHKDVEIIFGKAYGIDENSKINREYLPKTRGPLNYKNFLKGKITYNLTAMFFRTDVFNKINYFKVGATSEDLYFHNKIWEKCKIAQVNEFLSYYRSHDGNTTKNSWLMYQESLKYLETCKNEKYYKILVRNARLNFFAGLSKDYKDEALKYLIPSLRFFYTRLFVIGIINLLNLRKIFRK